MSLTYQEYPIFQAVLYAIEWSGMQHQLRVNLYLSLSSRRHLLNYYIKNLCFLFNGCADSLMQCFPDDRIWTFISWTVNGSDIWQIVSYFIPTTQCCFAINVKRLGSTDLEDQCSIYLIVFLRFMVNLQGEGYADNYQVVTALLYCISKTFLGFVLIAFLIVLSRWMQFYWCVNSIWLFLNWKRDLLFSTWIKILSCYNSFTFCSQLLQL